ncbi:calcium-activated chloride channel regulator 1-like isoform X1 [Tachypleus tridentatus]|uniref:calcium-activated chloride channel regulator 1-like isoform X1 n=1 Tax=Tachypleus tridentatus TaxID=6853 RepID=UPI003FD330CC
MLVVKNMTFIISAMTVLFWTICISKASFVTLDRNKYNGIVVALSPEFNLTADDPVKIIQQLKSLIRKSSAALFVTTRQRAFFGSVTLLIPKSWSLQNGWNQTLNFISQIEQPSLELYENSDIFVQPDGGKFGDVPFTLQPQSCGKLGHHIQITGTFLQSLNSNQHGSEDGGKIFVHEWAHYRYGIFDEHGFPDDPLYPLYYGIPGRKSKAQATDCANNQVQYDKRNQTDSECEPVFDINTGKPPKNNNCFFIAKQQGTENDGILSSLMSQHFLPKVAHFCDGTGKYQHNVEAPTKHNALCREKSTWSVIKQNQDFINGNNAPQTVYLSDVDFKYVQEKNLRIVISFDSSGNMNPFDRFSILLSALKKVLNEFPLGIEIGMVHFNEEAHIVKEMTILNANEECFTKVLPDRPVGHQACVECGIQKSLELLSANSQSIHGSTIVLVTTGDITEKKIQLLRNNLTAASVRLFIILYHESENATSSLLNLAYNTTGRLIHVREENIEKSLSFINLINLYEAFQLVLQGHSWEYSDLPITILKSIINGSSDVISLNFPVDRTLGDLKVQIFFKEENKLSPICKDSILVTSPTTQYSFTSQEFKTLEEMYFFYISDVEEGSWHLNAKVCTKSEQPLVVLITSRKKTTQKPLILKAWLSDNVYQFDPSQIPPPIVFAHLQHGTNPVSGAKVIANIHYQDGQMDSFELFDYGIGDPDITKGDGIYSGYLTTITAAGHYWLTISAHDNNGRAKVLYGRNRKSMPRNLNHHNCCGSYILEDSAAPTGRFMRQVNYGSFFVTNAKVNTDIYPPNRIVDFRVMQVDQQSKQVLLVWTSPGNDYDKGKATNYFIKYFDKRGDVLNRFDEDVGKIIDVWNINGPPLVPESYGTEQKVLVDLHDIQQDKIFYFGIQGVDEAGNKGIVSNVVAVFFSSNSVSPTVSHSFSLDSTMSSSTQDPAADKKIKLNKAGLSTGNIALTVSFVLLLLIIILVLLVFFCKRKSKNKKRPNQSCSKPLRSEKDAVDNVDFGYGVKEEHVMETLLKPINPSPAEAVV